MSSFWAPHTYRMYGRFLTGLIQGLLEFVWMEGFLGCMWSSKRRHWRLCYAPKSEKRSLLLVYLPHKDLSFSFFSSLHQTFVSCFYQLRGGGSWNAIWAALTRTLLSLSLLLSARLCTVVENGLNPPKISSSQLISPEYRGLSRAWVRNLKLRVPLIT